MRDAPTILHVDMDAFYAAIEMKEDPSLRGQPVIVGGSGPRGVVASCSYEARSYGIHSAMPSMRARQLCPHAIFLHGRFDLYGAYSRRIHEVFAAFTPVIESIALDEAFLDVAAAVRLFGEPPEIAAAIRERIQSDVGLASAVGVATTKLLAKLASRHAKPRPSPSGPVGGEGVVVIEPGRELEFLHPLPVEALWGVGPATRKRLDRFGVHTIGDLAGVPLESMIGALGPSLGRQLHDLAWARDERPVEANRPAKTIGNEQTYARDLTDAEDLRREVVKLADGTAGRLRKNGLVARTVVLKVRFADFKTITRSHTVPAPTDTTHEITAAALALLATVDAASGIRLLGVTVSNLLPLETRQLSFDDDGAAWDRASQAVDDVRNRFGADAIGPAVLTTAEGLAVKREGDTQWGPKPD